MLRQLLTLTAVVAVVSGHGRVLEPPSRASMWRSGFPTEKNYDDDGLNCGGFARQHEDNGGKCGICGDAFDIEEPRPHEIGGMYGSGMIVAEYKSGQVFEAIVDLTVYHKGYWQFKICPDPTTTNQSCFDEYPVELEEGGTKYYPKRSDVYKVNYRLPEGLVCDHCVLQWKYVAGNNWGYCDDGTSGLGCGNQENFGACTDISIKPIDDIVVPLEVASLHGIDQDLLELLRDIVLRIPPKKTNSNAKKRKNHRKPRARDKPWKRKKSSYESSVIEKLDGLDVHVMMKPLLVGFSVLFYYFINKLNLKMLMNVFILYIPGSRFGAFLKKQPTIYFIRRHCKS